MGLGVRVGITGASGLIGRSLVAALHERGDTTTAFVRPSTNVVTGNVVRWDPKNGTIDDGDLRRAGGFDVVVHLAGEGIGDHRWTDARKREILNSRVDSTTLLVRGLRELSQGVALVASGSAIGWYGSRGDEILDETSPPGEGFLSDVCQRWEDATLPLRGEGTSVALLRTGIVVSARGGAVKKQLPLFRLGLGGRLDTGQQWMSPISLLDEVRALLWIIDHHLTGPVNLCLPEPLTNSQFTQCFARQLRRPALLRVPKTALKVVLGTQMADELVLASQRVTPRVLREAGFIFSHLNASTALNWALTLEKSLKGQ
jgi:uncharacterized protein (TIGR01777 family)